MKITLSKRTLSIIIATALLISTANLYLLLSLQRDFRSNDSNFNYVVFQQDGMAKAKNQNNGVIDFSSSNVSEVIEQSIKTGNCVYIKAGEYFLDSDIHIFDQKNARIVSDGANITANGHSFIIGGANYTLSQYNKISGFIITNGSLRIENSFATTVADMTFRNCVIAIEVANSKMWTEGTKIDNTHFINCTEGIAFRTPTGNSTGSYASSIISRCFFNQLDNSIGIHVESMAEFSDSQLLNLRLWLGENGENNQTGLLVDGAMFQTLLSNVVFESFAVTPSKVYGIAIGENADPAPTLGDGVSFLGNWTARVYNPSNIWLPGTGSLFKRSAEIPIGKGNVYGETINIHARPITISNFKPKIQIQGALGEGETITVRFRLEFVDNVISPSVEKTITNATSVWLSDDDMLKLFPSQDVIWAILIDAKTANSSTNASVIVDIYGITT